MNKFNPQRDIRIDRVRAHHTYLRPPKDPLEHRKIEHKTPLSEVPWEIRNVKHLNAGNPNKKFDKKKIFDYKNDGKPIKVKKQTKAQKMGKAFVMMDSKKYHEVNGKFKPM